MPQIYLLVSITYLLHIYFSKPQIISHNFLCRRAQVPTQTGYAIALVTAQIPWFNPDVTEKLLLALCPAQGQHVHVHSYLLAMDNANPRARGWTLPGEVRVHLPPAEGCRHQMHYKRKPLAGTSDTEAMIKYFGFLLKPYAP